MLALLSHPAGGAARPGPEGKAVFGKAGNRRREASAPDGAEDQPLGAQACKLADNDVVEIIGIKMGFFLG